MRNRLYITYVCIEMLRKHPEELNISDFALQEILYLHKEKMKVYKEEMDKINRMGENYG